MYEFTTTKKYKQLLKKISNLTKASFRIVGQESPVFLTIVPTIKCNLKCSYCYQISEDTKENMSFKQYQNIIKKAKELGISMISFRGGEPLIWKSLTQAIALASENGISTQITSNGKSLSYEYIDGLAEAGLDVLNVSIDGVNYLTSSKKTIADNPDIIELLSYARDKYGIVVFSNAVLSEDNIHEVEPLIEILNQKQIPISLGLKTDPLNKRSWEYNYYETIQPSILKEKNSQWLFFDGVSTPLLAAEYK